MRERGSSASRGPSSSCSTRDVELSTPAADPDLMSSLAAWTRQEGGRAVAPEELPKLLGELGQTAAGI